ncbi:MAG TPA: VWA domain-containing protein [Candidatus Cybelea sp.]|nr:VWA domain-containing protein [Candidatus Cybelea sp.]
MIPSRRGLARHLRALFFLFLAAVSICGSCVPWSRAQTSAPQAQTPLQASTELVKVDASVLDDRGNFVGGLARNNFRILDNGSNQPIAYFIPVQAPAQILVMIETSPAVYLIHNQHLVAAYALLDGLAADDEVALVTYDQSPREVLNFTPDKSALFQALGGVQYTIGMGDLNFYDSVSGVLDWLGPAAGKRALVLLTTGLDSSGPARWDALVRKLRTEDIVIFSVALGGSLRSHPTTKPKSRPETAPSGGQETAVTPESSADSFANADRALRELAAVTGGRAYFPNSEQDFVPMYHEIATALRNQYLLGIAPAHDGQYHSLSVEVLDASGQPVSLPAKKPAVRVFARQGYLAPGP